MNMNEMTNAQLVEHHNTLSPEKQLTAWKGKKTDLIKKIIDLSPSEGTVRECALELLCKVDHFADLSGGTKAAKVVEESDPNARSVGLPYNEVIEGIQAKFPLCKTTVACLRWYAVKVRAEEEGYEGLRLPQFRPRVKKAD